MIKAICHLIDDASYGGINQMLEFMVKNPNLAKTGKHQIVRVKRGQFSVPSISADLIVSHLALSWKNLPMITLLRAGNPRTKFIHVEHNYCERFVASRVKNKERFKTLMQISFSMMDGVVAVSNEQRDWMVRRDFCSKEKLSVIEPCVDLVKFLDVKTRKPSNKIKLGIIGRLDHQKGFDILVQAFKQTQRQDIELHIFGSGPQEDILDAFAGDDPRITFHGFKKKVSNSLFVPLNRLCPFQAH